MSKVFKSFENDEEDKKSLKMVEETDDNHLDGDSEASEFSEKGISKEKEENDDKK